MTGIISNNNNEIPEKIIYREFGNGADDFIDRSKEKATFISLGLKGFAPKYLGGGDKYRMEEFY